MHTPLPALLLLLPALASVASASQPPPLSKITNASSFRMLASTQLGARAGPHAVDTPAQCAVWNWRGGNTLWIQPDAPCAPAAVAAETEAEAFAFEDGKYMVRFEVSDWKDWREIEVGVWTRLRLDQTAACEDGEGNDGVRMPRCVISPVVFGKGKKKVEEVEGSKGAKGAKEAKGAKGAKEERDEL
ncbi:hypothetical protein EDC01DRAFT_775929 [Geopyxis carbonaria]|nr:hypothetical protein EDC01DRAFT_775929 [Geopyxis carbonaria]